MNSDDPVASPEADAFYARAYRRIFRTMIVIPFLATPLIWFRWHGAMALSFLAGCVVGVVNFYWLKKTIEALAASVTQPKVARPSPKVVARFFLRYAFIAAVGYIIVKSSAGSIYGFCVGLFLPVGAILIEAVYEVYLALLRGF